MKFTITRPRLSSLELFASALLVSLGAQLQGGCGTEIIVNNGNGGSGGGSSSSSSNASNSSSGGGMGGSGTGGGMMTSSSSGPVFMPGDGNCVDPMPVIVDGVDTGVDICKGGQYRRREAIACPTGTPPDATCCGTCPDGYICSNWGEIACSCVLKCTVDSDCGANQLCLCTASGGHCENAKCLTGTDCAEGQNCTSWDSTLGCMYLEFACTTPQDTCSGDLDCNSQVPGSFCAVQPDGHRQCQTGGCAIGRPFLIDGEARTANVIVRNDWCTNDTKPSVVGLDEQLREQLAQAWEHTARMEHASIAAFARFSLELLSLGAPSDLIERTNAAMVDETKHAKAAFAMVSVYRGKPTGPGRLSATGAMDDGDDVSSIMRRVIREGCVGETVAAVEAAEASEAALDAVVGQTLATIADDESRHAELAWRTVKWALETFGADVRHAILDEIALLTKELASVHEHRRTERDDALMLHGVVTDQVRASIRRATIRKVVLPCLSALLESHAHSIAPHTRNAAAVSASIDAGSRFCESARVD